MAYNGNGDHGGGGGTFQKVDVLGITLPSKSQVKSGAMNFARHGAFSTALIVTRIIQVLGDQGESFAKLVTRGETAPEPIAKLVNWLSKLDRLALQEIASRYYDSLEAKTQELLGEGQATQDALISLFANASDYNLPNHLRPIPTWSENLEELDIILNELTPEEQQKVAKIYNQFNAEIAELGREVFEVLAAWQFRFNVDDMMLNSSDSLWANLPILTPLSMSLFFRSLSEKDQHTLQEMINTGGATEFYGNLTHELHRRTLVTGEGASRENAAANGLSLSPLLWNGLAPHPENKELHSTALYTLSSNGRHPDILASSHPLLATHHSAVTLSDAWSEPVVNPATGKNGYAGIYPWIFFGFGKDKLIPLHDTRMVTPYMERFRSRKNRISTVLATNACHIAAAEYNVPSSLDEVNRHNLEIDSDTPRYSTAAYDEALRMFASIREEYRSINGKPLVIIRADADQQLARLYIGYSRGDQISADAYRILRDNLLGRALPPKYQLFDEQLSVAFRLPDGRIIERSEQPERTGDLDSYLPSINNHFAERLQEVLQAPHLENRPVIIALGGVDITQYREDTQGKQTDGSVLDMNFLPFRIKFAFDGDIIANTYGPGGLPKSALTNTINTKKYNCQNEVIIPLKLEYTVENGDKTDTYKVVYNKKGQFFKFLHEPTAYIHAILHDETLHENIPGLEGQPVTAAQILSHYSNGHVQELMLRTLDLNEYHRKLLTEEIERQLSERDGMVCNFTPQEYTILVEQALGYVERYDDMQTYNGAGQVFLDTKGIIQEKLKDSGLGCPPDIPSIITEIIGQTPPKNQEISATQFRQLVTEITERLAKKQSILLGTDSLEENSPRGTINQAMTQSFAKLIEIIDPPFLLLEENRERISFAVSQGDLATCQHLFREAKEAQISQAIARSYDSFTEAIHQLLGQNTLGRQEIRDCLERQDPQCLHTTMMAHQINTRLWEHLTVYTNEQTITVWELQDLVVSAMGFDDATEVGAITAAKTALLDTITSKPPLLDKLQQVELSQNPRYVFQLTTAELHTISLQLAVLAEQHPEYSRLTPQVDLNALLAGHIQQELASIGVKRDISDDIELLPQQYQAPYVIGLLDTALDAYTKRHIPATIIEHLPGYIELPLQHMVSELLCDYSKSLYMQLSHIDYSPIVLGKAEGSIELSLSTNDDGAVRHAVDLLRIASASTSARPLALRVLTENGMMEWADALINGNMREEAISPLMDGIHHKIRQRQQYLTESSEKRAVQANQAANPENLEFTTHELALLSDGSTLNCAFTSSGWDTGEGGHAEEHLHVMFADPAMARAFVRSLHREIMPRINHPAIFEEILGINREIVMGTPEEREAVANESNTDRRKRIQSGRLYPFERFTDDVIEGMITGYLEQYIRVDTDGHVVINTHAFKGKEHIFCGVNEAITAHLQSDTYRVTTYLEKQKDHIYILEHEDTDTEVKFYCPDKQTLLRFLHAQYGYVPTGPDGVALVTTTDESIKLSPGQEDLLESPPLYTFTLPYKPELSRIASQTGLVFTSLLSIENELHEGLYEAGPLLDTDHPFKGEMKIAARDDITLLLDGIKDQRQAQSIQQWLDEPETRKLRRSQAIKNIRMAEQDTNTTLVRLEQRHPEEVAETLSLRKELNRHLIGIRQRLQTNLVFHNNALELHAGEHSTNTIPIFYPICGEVEDANTIIFHIEPQAQTYEMIQNALVRTLEHSLQTLYTTPAAHQDPDSLTLQLATWYQDTPPNTTATAFNRLLEKWCNERQITFPEELLNQLRNENSPFIPDQQATAWLEDPSYPPEAHHLVDYLHTEYGIPREQISVSSDDPRIVHVNTALNTETVEQDTRQTIILEENGGKGSTHYSSLTATNLIRKMGIAFYRPHHGTPEESWETPHSADEALSKLTQRIMHDTHHHHIATCEHLIEQCETKNLNALNKAGLVSPPLRAIYQDILAQEKVLFGEIDQHWDDRTAALRQQFTDIMQLIESATTHSNITAHLASAQPTASRTT